ncbi:MAG: branched-chain amino acid transport system II carrier protein [Parafannyhessea sp.]|uniref:branched-chain amino acid transport system II carrier protein n=1 Tax=Parafannyhessea sp. TaxID=2847324 RepID=UPI003F01EB83
MQSTGVAGGRLTRRDGLTVGITLFSMLFGAGNLILCPLLGVRAGTATPLATLGFLVSGVGLPIAMIAAVSLAGSARELGDRIGRAFSLAFVTLTYLCIGPLLAIPRTASTSFEMVVPLLPRGVDMTVAQLLYSVAFFVVAFVLALHPTRLKSLMGKVTGPLLLGLIAVLVVGSIAAPAGTAGKPTDAYASAPVAAGFQTGYQTLDLLAALAFGYVIAMNVRSLGLSEPRAVAMQVSRSGIVAGGLMALVYCGLSYVGYTMGSVVPDAGNGAQVISSAATGTLGVAGRVLVAVIFVLACFNVCVGLVTSIAQYFDQAFPRISYRWWAAIVSVVSCAIANVGLTAILAWSVPVLNAIYPMGICLMVMGLVEGPGDGVGQSAPSVGAVPEERAGREGQVGRSARPRRQLMWRLVVLAAGVVSVSESVRNVLIPAAWLPSDALPLAGMGMAWVVPAVVAAAVGLACEWLVAAR